MDIDYTLGPDDIVAFNRYHFKASPGTRRSYQRGLLSGVAVAVVLFLVFRGWESWLSALFPVVFLLFYVIAYPWSIRRSINGLGRQVAKEGRNRGLLTAHHFSIDEAGLVDRTSVTETRTSWEGVERVVQTDAHIFIYVSATSAHVIPKSAFATPQQAQEFFELARKYQSSVASSQ